jgi:hypothetical protein
MLTIALTEFISGDFSNPFEFSGFTFGNAPRFDVDSSLGSRSMTFLRNQAFSEP